MSISIQRSFLALDNKTRPEVFELLAQLRDQQIKLPLKIGLELFCAHGPGLVEDIHRDYPSDIFLDLKLHDIPNTVAQAVKSLKDLPIRWLTLHLTGGASMLTAAREAALQHCPKLGLLGVSYLTSLDAQDFAQVWNVNGAQEQTQAFERAFKLALAAPLAGVVCSAHEAKAFKQLMDKQADHKNLVCVCPGIRFSEELAKSQQQDQKRVMDPKTAFSLGADYLVLGRSLTEASPYDREQRLIKLAQFE